MLNVLRRVLLPSIQAEKVITPEILRWAQKSLKSSGSIAGLSDRRLFRHFPGKQEYELREPPKTCIFNPQGLKKGIVLMLGFYPNVEKALTAV